MRRSTAGISCASKETSAWGGVLRAIHPLPGPGGWASLDVSLIGTSSRRFSPTMDRVDFVSFGASGIEVRARQCVMTVPHETIECELPPSAGSELAVYVSVGGQLSSGEEPLPRFSYGPPKLRAILSSPSSLRTNGGSIVIVVGESLGPAQHVELRLDGELVAIQQSAADEAHNSSRVAFVMPPGTGSRHKLVARSLVGVSDGSPSYVESHSQDSEPLPISYAPPLIDDASPAETDEEARATALRIVGANLGGDASLVSIVVTGISSVVCIPRALEWTHDYGICDLSTPLVSGVVWLEVDGQSLADEYIWRQKKAQVETGWRVDGGSLHELPTLGGSMVSCFVALARLARERPVLSGL